MGDMSIDLSIPWDRLLAVGLRTTSDGPFSEDVFWQFLLADGCVEVPGAQIDGDALAGLQARLPGLDSEKIIRAMGSTDERTFRLWHRDESGWRPDDGALTARFAGLIGRLGGEPAAAGAVAVRLLAAWSAADRHYHDREHLLDCLREVDGARGAADTGVAGGGPAAGSLDAVELALWYHDVVYRPGAADSEEESARVLVADSAALGLPAAAATTAADLVRATAHASAPPAPGSAAVDLLLDIDLSILGRDPLRFMEFEHGVEEEYAALPTATFRRGRAAFLRGMLARPHLFRTAALRDRFEAPARRNLAALLAGPRYRGG